MNTPASNYIPAAGRDWMLPLYDPLVRLLGVDRARRPLLERAAVEPSHRVLDIGCGTATFAVLVARLHPGVDVVGLDPDPKALARARRKADRSRTAVRLDRGFADNLPYADASFDRVFSSFMFHHLRGDEKDRALREARRVLGPGGSLHLVDFAGPGSGEEGHFTRRLHSSQLLQENTEHAVLTRMREAGFANPQSAGRGTLFFGHIKYVYYRATAE